MAPAAELTEAPADPTEAPAAEASDDEIDPAEAAASAAAAAIADLDFGDGTASVVLGGETIEFSLGSSTDAAGNPQVGGCRDVFGIIQAAGFATDGRDIKFNAAIPPTDWETYEDERCDAPSVELEIAEGNRNLVADADQAAEFGYEGSAVTEFEADGTTASGPASFVDTWKPADDPARAPVSGTFQVACAN